MSTRTPEELRRADAERIAAALKLALQTMESADHYWGLWADDVRWTVKQRLGRSAEPDDQAVLADDEYGAALDLRRDIERITGELRDLGKHFDHLGTEYDAEWHQP